ncbi:hypothetical protein [Bradymonas sediminis]|uniref:Uncharacterized protein n=1 Tax=Bradymonas sediminis TaxID=1548548 RepID=A0A2Z4FGW7_9DELT|nr:hypothetical protein [Bradymonas sediminis]AWV88179.1 hypothetical protein DN745_02030 [Bradymonas sediminis]TDP77302.1 hypothetical protein DFR33_101202 [Bradymonas sediminis]
MADDPNKLELTHNVESRILKSLRKRKGVATAGDVAADTGLGYEQVDWALQQMLDLYKSHLDVDDEGNLRYRFDPALTRRGADPGRTWRKVKRVAWRTFVVVFKVWTMAMLVGYTIAFILLILAASLAAIGASASSDEGGDIGDAVMLPFMLVARFLEYMFWWNLFSSPNQGYYGNRRRRSRGGMFGGMGRKPYQKPSKAFYQKIFDYLFGPELPKADPLAPARAFAEFARSRNGRITAADWASRTGQSLDEAHNALGASLGRFRGDVDVTDDGTLVYRFDDLMVTADEADMRPRSALAPVWERKVTVPSFTGNDKKSNTRISLLNGFNLFMALAVLLVVQGLPLAAVIGLGWIPLIFSAMFFAIPLLRKRAHNKRAKQAEVENERRQALQVVFESAEHGGIARPVPEAAIPPTFQNSFLLDYEGDIQVTNASQNVYTFERLATDFEDGRRAREQANEVVFGKTVFSSDKEEKDLDEEAMEEFDRRLAMELGGDVFEVEQAQAAYAQVGR